MNIDRQTIKQYLSQLTPADLAALAEELRADWQLPERSTVVVEPPPPSTPAVVGYDVVLEDLGPSRVATIRALRAAFAIDLRAARDLIGQLPAVLGREAARADAEALATTLRENGATVTITAVTA